MVKGIFVSGIGQILCRSNVFAVAYLQKDVFFIWIKEGHSYELVLI
jgi:hypothetical protein